MASRSVPANSGELSQNLPAPIRLPRSSSRLARSRAFCQLVTGVRHSNGHLWLDGPLYPPGAVIQLSDKTGNLVLECAGPESAGRGHNRPEVLWILWRWATISLNPAKWSGACGAVSGGEWRECGRALAIGREWIHILGPLAEHWLTEPVALHEVKARCASLAEEIAEMVQNRVRREPIELQKQVWESLYDQIPGRIVE